MAEHLSDLPPADGSQQLRDSSAEALVGLSNIGPLLAAARALSELHVNDVAKLSMLGTATIRRAEASRTSLTPANLDRLVSMYADRGIYFVKCESDRRGVIVSFAEPLSVRQPSQVAAVTSRETARRAPRRRQTQDGS